MKKLQQKYNAFSCAFHMDSLNVNILSFPSFQSTTHPRTAPQIKGNYVNNPNTEQNKYEPLSTVKLHN